MPLKVISRSIRDFVGVEVALGTRAQLLDIDAGDLPVFDHVFGPRSSNMNWSSDVGADLPRMLAQLR